MSRSSGLRTQRLFGGVLVAGGLALAACSGSSSPSSAPANTATSGNGAASSSAASEVLPVTSNPIHNTATATPLAIKSVVVENNVGSSGKPTGDHLEITLTNSSAKALVNVEVFYTYTDPTAKTSESYYFKLPSSFTVPAGGTRTAHFDSTGKPDHFPVNKFSLYHTSKNALDVTVVVSADGAAPQTATVKKAAGGAEVAD